MKLIKSSTIVLILFNIICFNAFAQEEGVESESFQRIKQELWAFGPTSQPLKNSAQQAENKSPIDMNEVQKTKQDFVPEELSRALMKYSVEL